MREPRGAGHVGYNCAQRGFALCAGQLLPISQNTALFSLLGTTYGGDGVSTFGLPDLRGRTAIGMGHGPGLSNRTIGQRGGSETNTLTVAEMPAHNHTATLHGETAAASASIPTNQMLGIASIYAPQGAGPDQAMAAESISVSNTGGNLPVNNMQPFLTLNYEIALQGLYPSRS